MATNYGEIFCQATEQLIQTALAGQKYDITKDCTVVAIPKKQDGLYSVSDGSVTFDAYAAAGTSYAKGDQVLVTIPQGDWNKQKTIINKIVTETSGGINYTSPLSTFIKGTDNLITNYNTSIQANGKTELGKDIYFTPLYTIECDSSVYVGFKSFAIAGEFMTALDGLGLTNGEYGIKILIYSDAKDAAVADLMWSSSDMLGNPYSFNSYFKQEAVFSIPSSIDTITKIELCLYQNGQFGDGTEIFNDFPQGIHNIFVKNLELYLGFEGGSVNNNSISISASNLNYTTTDTVRHLLLRWFYRSEDGEFASVNTFYDPDAYEVRWYQYESGTTDKDEYGGNNWKWLNKNGEPNLSHSDYPFVLPVKMLPSRNSEKFKAIGLVKTHPLLNDPDYVSITSFESDVLTFTFTKTNNGDEPSTNTPSENTPADIIRSAFSLNFDDGSYGNYYLYDQNGILLRPADEGSARERSVTIFAYDSELDDKYELYDYIDWIKWEVPGDHSMISYAKSQAFENPNENLINALDTAIEYSSFGSFDFFIGINNETEATKVRINVYTADGSNNWENNSPYTYITSIGEGMNVIANVFTINRSYQQIKINAVLLDESGNEISDSIDYSDLLFKPVSTLHSYIVQPVRNADGTVSIDNKFLYSIANNWNQDRMHNTIKCTISIAGIEVILAETLRFGKQGTSGTGYTFLLEMLEGYNALIPGQTTQIEAILLNQNGKQIYFPNEQSEEGKEVDYKKVQWDILGYDDKDEVPITWTTTERQEIISLTVNAGASLTSNYCILQASYEYEGTDEASGKSPTLYAYLPLAIKHQDIISMSGAQQVIYGHMGTPTYSKAQYTLFDKNNNELTDGWYINNPPINIHQNPNALTLKNGCLSAAAMYSKGADDGFIYDRYCVYYKDEQDQILWSQPILIMQSAYDYAMLNSWDGNLTIDENNGTILSTMLGAGSKNNENQFSGVLIGDVAEGTDLNSAPQHTGVYGFKDGIMSFGFRDNGTAFIGESGRGQILFDGNKGQITSPTLTQDENGNVTAITPGIAIDLDDASILISGQSEAKTKRNLFEIYLDNNPLVHISDDAYYLKSDGYKDEGDGVGFKIDLKSGFIDANSLYIKTSNFILNSTDNSQPYFQIKDSHSPQHILFNAEEENYYLQTCGYDENAHRGMKIDLSNNLIKAYDFNLVGKTAMGDWSGSYLSLNSAPEFEIHFKNASKKIDLNVFHVSDQNFYLQSLEWHESKTTKTVTTATAASGYNIRSGPGTNYSIVGHMGEKRQVNIYDESTGQGSSMWYKISTEDEWIASGAISNIKRDQQINETVGSGVRIDLQNGYFSLYNKQNSGTNLLIDSTQKDYPIQLGEINNGYNLKLGWDGSLRGGTTYDWRITSDGKATFNRLSSGWATISGGSVGGCTISGNSISGKNWSLSADGGASFASLSVGSGTSIYDFTPKRILYGYYAPGYTSGGSYSYVASIHFDTDGNYQRHVTRQFKYISRTMWVVGAEKQEETEDQN